eukprot:GGOE01049024.1.p1 GENE.GGOE01049024.1~~GGOE01049024.1.p1  ORF type:complete len:758 (-),score=174.79 GGOE01049024.1:660-2837(-)
MDTFVGKTFNLWCIFLFFFFVVMEGLWYTLPRTTFVLTLPYVLVLILLFFLFVLMNCAPGSKRHIPTVLPLVCTVTIGLVAWGAHRLISQAMQNAAELSLVQTMALVNGHTEIKAELEGYIRNQVSRKSWYFAMLIMYINVDALRLTGTTHNALYVHLVPLIVILVTTYCSDQISHNSIDVISVAVVFTVYTMLSSAHMLAMFRDRFRFDYQLRQRMAKEAEMIEAARDMEAAQQQASQKADTMLNHILKNIMADAHGCIDLFFGKRGFEAADDLRRAQESLERGMRWCKKRQVMVQVNSGDYTPVLAPVSLKKLIDGMVCGRDIVVDMPDVTVCLDALLCEVVLDNAISNAFRHGDTTLGPISLVVSATHTGKEQSMGVIFTLTNYTSDSHRLNPELVNELAKGHDVGGLVNVPALSDHLGLRHMFMAAAAHHMATSLAQADNLVIFTASLEVYTSDSADSKSGAPAALPTPRGAAATFPTGLRILCLDDSEIARRVLLHGLTAHAPQTACQAYGATMSEVAIFEAEALSGADVLILDQHLDYHVTIYGTDIAQRLRRAGYCGLICIRSANATDEDQVMYLQSGADCMIGKDTPLQEMVETLQLAYAQHLCDGRTKQTDVPARERVSSLGLPFGVNGPSNIGAPPPSPTPNPDTGAFATGLLPHSVRISHPSHGIPSLRLTGPDKTAQLAESPALLPRPRGPGFGPLFPNPSLPLLPSRLRGKK